VLPRKSTCLLDTRCLHTRGPPPLGPVKFWCKQKLLCIIGQKIIMRIRNLIEHRRMRGTLSLWHLIWAAFWPPQHRIFFILRHNVILHLATIPTLLVFFKFHLILESQANSKIQVREISHYEQEEASVEEVPRSMGEPGEM
jgi:hypothetical protein